MVAGRVADISVPAGCAPRRVTRATPNGAPVTSQTQSHTNSVPSHWWSEPQETVLASLQVDPARGLLDEQVQGHRTSLGTNVLEEIRPVVTGDIVLLSEGMRVPADIRLLESHGLLVNEAPLTGESLPVQKNARAVVAKEAGPADRVNCALAGTTVVTGEGKGVVLAVGGASEFGQIARAAQAQRKERTLIQDAMTRLAKTLAVLAIIVSLLIPLVGFLRGLDLQEMILTWLALTFLMIPGQPPVIITMALALASFELARKHIVVKRLRGAEILGQVTAIVADKTGTLTENKMTVERFILSDRREVKPPDLPPDLRDGISRCLPRYSNDPTDKAVHAAVTGSRDGAEYSLLQGFSEGHPWRTLADDRRLNVVDRGASGLPCGCSSGQSVEHHRQEPESRRRTLRTNAARHSPVVATTVTPGGNT